MRASDLKNGLRTMNKPSNISIDQSFQNAFERFEPSFQDGDWDDMLSRLESQDTPILLLPPKHIFTNTKHTIIMILLTTLTAGMIWIASPQHVDVTPNTNNTVQTTQPLLENSPMLTESIQKGEKSTSEQINQTTTSQFVKQAEVNLNDYIASLQEPMMEEENLMNEVQANPHLDLNPAISTAMSSAEQDVASPDTARFLKTVVSRYWVDTTYKYIQHKPSRDIEEGWIGFYYANQQLSEAQSWTDIGRHPETHGFNLQFMSGNILPGENLAIYGGIDWGMQFYGRSEKSEVIINSVNEDRGLTFLRSHSNDIFISGQIEWAQLHRVVPYMTGSIGGRILSTGQTTRALLPSTEYESTQDNGVHTRGVLASKAGIGMKFRLSPHVFLDARYEWIQTADVQTVDYNNTAFNGLSYDLGFKKLNMNADQFRVGIVFDLGGDDYEKVVDEPGHWEETTQTLYVDPSDSSKVYVPCPCDKPKSKKRTYRSNTKWNEPTNDGRKELPGSNGGIFSPGSGSGNDKSGFPGLKKPPVRW